MGIVKNLMVRAGADFSGLRKETIKANKILNDFKQSTTQIFGKIKAIIATLAIGKLIKDSIASAMEVESAIQQIKRIMGESSNQFLKWASTQAIAFNMSKADAIKYGRVFVNLISVFSKGTKEAQQNTVSLLKASSIVASSTGRTMEDVMERMRSGLLGNTEAIEDLGINVNVAMIQSTAAFRRFAGNKSWQQLDYQTQQQIRLFAILEQATQKYGDSINNNTTSMQQQFVAQLKNIQLSLGNAFLPIYQVILPALTELASKIAYITSIFADFMQALFGKVQKNQSSVIDSQSSSVNELGDAYVEAGKKASGALAGFDEINKLTTTSTAGSNGSSVADPSAQSIMDEDVQVPDISSKVKNVADKVKNAFSEMKEAVITNKDIIISSLTGIGVAFGAFQVISKWGSIVSVVKTALTGLAAAIGAISLPAVLIAAAIGALIGAFVYFYKTNEKFRGTVETILNSIKDAAFNLWNNVLVPFGHFLGNVFVVAWQSLSVALSWIHDVAFVAIRDIAIYIWQNILVPLADYLVSSFSSAWTTIATTIKWVSENILTPLGQTLEWLWKTVIVPLGSILIEYLGNAFNMSAEMAKSFWQNVLVPLGSFMLDVLGPAIDLITSYYGYMYRKLEPLAQFYQNVLIPVLKVLAKYLANNVKTSVETVINILMFLWTNVLGPISKFLSTAFAASFDNMTKFIGAAIESLKYLFIGLMEFLTGVFTEDWEKAWTGIKDIFKGIFGGLYDIVKVPLNLIIDSINTVIKGLNSIKIDIPKGVPVYGGTSFGVNIPKIPKLAVGTNYVPRDMLAMLHKGEAVVPKPFNPATGSSNNEETNRLLKKIYEALLDGKVLMVDKKILAQTVTSGQNSSNRMAGFTTIEL